MTPGPRREYSKNTFSRHAIFINYYRSPWDRFLFLGVRHWKALRRVDLKSRNILSLTKPIESGANLRATESTLLVRQSLGRMTDIPGRISV